MDIGSSFITISKSWPELKTIIENDNLTLRSEIRGGLRYLFAVDMPIAYVCTLFLGEVPYSAAISQTDNDGYISDYETNYAATANAPINKFAINGVVGNSPAKGLGGFAPDPKNNPYSPSPDEISSLYVDIEGQLMTRGATYTDEGSIRDDFVGSALETDLTGTLTFTNGSNVVTGSGTLFTSEINRNYYIKVKTDTVDKWVSVVRAPTDTNLLLDSPYIGATATTTAHKTRWIKTDTGGTPGTVSVGSSKLTLASGTVNGGGIRISRDGDYPPELGVIIMSVSQRIANQTIFAGFRDSDLSPQMYCDIIFDGTDNTKVKFRSAWNGDEELTVVDLPTGLTTASLLRYKIDVCTDYCSLIINGVLVAKHENHIPDMYAALRIIVGILNSGTVTNTNVSVDSIYWANHDQVQISSSFQAPIPIITKEDQHSVFGKVTSTLTTANQTIISYTVPAGKVFYIIGYRVDTDGTVAGLIKIGRNSLSSEPAGPGSVDSNIFRSFVLGAGGSSGDIDFGGNPRKLGVGGDTILVTVSPLSIISTIWRVSLDFVLR